MAMGWKAVWRWGPGGGPGGPMVGTPCSVYCLSMISCLNPRGCGTANGSDICRWYGGRLSRARPLLLLPVGWGKNWDWTWLSDGGKGRHGSDICRWNLQEEESSVNMSMATTFNKKSSTIQFLINLFWKETIFALAGESSEYLQNWVMAAKFKATADMSTSTTLFIGTCSSPLSVLPCLPFSSFLTQPAVSRSALSPYEPGCLFEGQIRTEAMYVKLKWTEGVQNYAKPM